MKKMLTLLLCGMTLTMSGNIEGMKKFGRGGYSPKKQSTRPVVPPKVQKNISQDLMMFPIDFTSSGSDSDSTSSETPSVLPEGWRTKTACTKSSQEFIELQQNIDEAQKKLEMLKKQYEDKKSVNERLLKEQSEKESKAEDDKKSIDAEYDRLSKKAKGFEAELALLDKKIKEKEATEETRNSTNEETEGRVGDLEKNIKLAILESKCDKTVILSKYLEDLEKANSLIKKNGSEYKVNPNIDNFIRSLEEENTELRQKLEKFKENDKKAIAKIQNEIKGFDRRETAIAMSANREIERYDERIKENEAKISDLNKQISSDGEFYSFLDKMTTFLDEKCKEKSFPSALSEGVLQQNASVHNSLKEAEKSGKENVEQHIAVLKDEIDLWNKQKIEILTQQKQLLENIGLLKQSLVEQIKQHEQNMARFSLPGEIE